MWYFALGGSDFESREMEDRQYIRGHEGKEAKKQEHETDGNKIGISSLQCAARVTQTPAERRRGGKQIRFFWCLILGAMSGRIWRVWR